MTGNMRMRLTFACSLLAFAATMVTASPSGVGGNSVASAVPMAAKDEPYLMPRSEVRQMRSDAGGSYLIYIAWPQQAPPPGG